MDRILHKSQSTLNTKEGGIGIEIGVSQPAVQAGMDPYWIRPAQTNTEEKGTGEEEERERERVVGREEKERGKAADKAVGGLDTARNTLNCPVQDGSTNAAKHHSFTYINLKATIQW